MKSNRELIRFIKTSGIFLAGNVLSKAISFFLLPIYTGMIPVEDMGYYDVSITYMNMAVSVLYFEIWSAVLRFMYDKETEEKKYISIKTGIYIFSGSTIVYVFFATVLGMISNIQSLALVVIYGFLQCMVSFYSFSARGLGCNYDFALSGVLSVLINALVNIGLILGLRVGYTAMYYGFIIGSVVQILYLEMRTNIFRKALPLRVESNEIWSMFRYALPLCINTVSYWMLTGFNRLVVNWILGNAANGLLAIGNRFGVLISLVTTCFTYAWQDISFTKAQDTEDRSRFYSQACNLYFKFLIAGMLIILPICHWVFIIMIHDNYGEAEKTVPLFLMVGVLSAISAFIGNVFYAIKDTQAIFYSTVISAICNAIIVFPSVYFWELNGSNIAATTGFIINIIIRCILLKKKIGFAYDWKMFIGLIAYSLFIFSCFGNINSTGSLLMLASNILVVCVLFRNELKKF